MIARDREARRGEARRGMVRSHESADYVLCGWRVRSALPLPEVAPWRGDDRPPDVTILEILTWRRSSPPLSSNSRRT